MELDSNLVTGGGVVAMAWAVRELLTFFLKLKEKDVATYAPEEHWKTYCTQKFEDITEKLSQLTTSHEIIKAQMSRFELELLRAVKSNG